MARLKVERDWQAAHEIDGKPMWHDGTFRDWSPEQDEDHPFSRDDGVTISVADVDDGTWDALLDQAPVDHGDQHKHGDQQNQPERD